MKVAGLGLKPRGSYSNVAGLGLKPSGEGVGLGACAKGLKVAGLGLKPRTPVLGAVMLLLMLLKLKREVKLMVLVMLLCLSVQDCEKRNEGPRGDGFGLGAIVSQLFTFGFTPTPHLHTVHHDVSTLGTIDGSAVSLGKDVYR